MHSAYVFKCLSLSHSLILAWGHLDGWCGDGRCSEDKPGMSSLTNARSWSSSSTAIINLSCALTLVLSSLIDAFHCISPSICALLQSGPNAFIAHNVTACTTPISPLSLTAEDFLYCSMGLLGQDVSWGTPGASPLTHDVYWLHPLYSIVDCLHAVMLYLFPSINLLAQIWLISLSICAS